MHSSDANVTAWKSKERKDEVASSYQDKTWKVEPSRSLPKRLKTMKDHARAAALGDTVAVKYASQRFVTAKQLLYGRRVNGNPWANNWIQLAMYESLKHNTCRYH